MRVGILRSKVMFCYHFVVLRGTEFKFGMGVGPQIFRLYFQSDLIKGQEVIQRSSCFKNALWLPNLVGRTSDQRKCISGIKGHAEVTRSQPGVKLLRNMPRGYQIW